MGNRFCVSGSGRAGGPVFTDDVRRSFSGDVLGWGKRKREIERERERGGGGEWERRERKIE